MLIISEFKILFYFFLLYNVFIFNVYSNKTLQNVQYNNLIVKFSSHVPEADIHSLINEVCLNKYKYLPVLKCYIIQCRKRSTLKQIYEMKHICYAEPIFLLPILEDPFYPKQWSLNNTGQNGVFDADIDAPEGWAIEKGQKNIVIAVIDTGVDYNHPDLSGNIWSNMKEVPGNQVDDDNNGYIDDVVGWDFVESHSVECAENEDCLFPDNDPMDRQGHGTQISGIIAAETNNDIGISGIAQNCQLMPVRAGFKTSSGDGFLESIDAAQAIIYAVDNGAKVINVSWGDSVRSMVIEDAIKYAAEKDVLICAASGNDNLNKPIFPAASKFYNIISVGGTDGLDMKSYFSNYGNWVHIAAPGSSIFTTSINNSYEFKSGTSMATAHVSGCSALLFSHFYDISAMEVKAKLLRTADITEKLNEKNLISGRINLHRSLTESFVKPHIFSLRPDIAHENDIITIFGDSFGKNGNVFFSPGIDSEILSWTPQVITCVVPAKAESGNLTVINSQGYKNKQIDIHLKYYNVELIESRTAIIDDELQSIDSINNNIIYKLPFSFSFFGIEYNHVYISPKGFLSFEFEKDNILTHSSLRNLTSKKMIAPLWDDLSINGISQSNEGIYAKKINSESVCFQWIAEHCETEDPVIVQTVLFKNGNILFNYVIKKNTEISPTIGLSAGDNKAYEIIDITSFDLFKQSICFNPRLYNFIIELHKGWNMVSFPVLINHTPVSDILGETMPFIDIIWGYNNNIWSAYDPNMEELSDLVYFQKGRGYWIKSSMNNISIQCKGSLKYRSDIHLFKGWNLVGPDTLSSVAIDDKYESVWHYYEGYWFVNQYQSVQIFELEPGKGYWVKVAEK
jgi:hypothetical protein